MSYKPNLDGRRLSLNQVARQLDVNVSSVWRWALKGVRGVRLATFSIGAKRYATELAVDQFITATTAAADGMHAHSKTRTGRHREAAVSKAERECDRAGI